MDHLLDTTVRRQAKLVMVGELATSSKAEPSDDDDLIRGRSPSRDDSGSDTGSQSLDEDSATTSATIVEPGATRLHTAR